MMRGGIISVNGKPFLNLGSNARGGVFLMRLGFRAREENNTWHFWKPADKPSA
jgi:hypothetical protein